MNILEGGKLMQILDEKGLSGIVKRFLDLIFAGGILIFLSLPISIRWYMGLFYERTSERYYFLLPFLYVTGFFALLIVNEIRRIFKTLNRKSPFIVGNAKSLKRIAVSSFIIAFAYIIKIIFYNSFLTIIMAMVFIIAGLFSIILAEVFYQAAVVKEENDLTI